MSVNLLIGLTITALVLFPFWLLLVFKPKPKPERSEFVLERERIRHDVRSRFYAAAIIYVGTGVFVWFFVKFVMSGGPVIVLRYLLNGHIWRQRRVAVSVTRYVAEGAAVDAAFF